MENLLEKRSLVPIILPALLSAAIAGGAVYAIQNHRNQKAEADLQSQAANLKAQLSAAKRAIASPVPSPMPSLEPSATPEIASIVGWATYVNTHGYSIQYPTSRTATQVSLGDGDGGPNDPGLSGTAQIFLQDKNQSTRTISILAITCTDNQTLGGVTQALLSANTNNQIVSKQTSTIGGKQGYTIEVKTGMAIDFCGTIHQGSIPQGEYSSPVSITAVPDGKKLFVFVNSTSADSEGQKMLSTVHFAE